ncbi:venom allergen 5.02-like [Achroia grisella]|uniref:venom allergen 5.02-like n=1 Tax=Achroia grisella TaxID=688607 RepID=UPI0027D2E71B|nr:venom allergen 5.02-like [Achroia grisella]
MAIRAVFLLALFSCTQCKNLTCKQIREIVDGHNLRRWALAKGEVSGQPAASSMNYMVWDDELAAKASKWASRNEFKHNPDSTIGTGRFETGENIYMFSTTGRNLKLNITDFLDSWFNEYKYYTYGSLSDADFETPDEKQIGHYTQMAWSNSTHVGCGVSQFAGGKWNSQLIVCNYGPAGNVIGASPYKSGTPSKSLICAIGNCKSPYGDKC